MIPINHNPALKTQGPTTPLSQTLPTPSVEAIRNESLAELIDALLNSTNDAPPEALTEAQRPSDQAEQPGKQSLQQLLSLLLNAIQSWLKGGQAGDQGHPNPSANVGGKMPSRGGERPGAPSEPEPRGAPQAPSSSAGVEPTPGDGSALPAHDIDTSRVDTSKIPDYNALSPKVQEAAKIAVAMGLRVTSTTGGKHSTTSNHYKHNSSDGKGHAIDIAGPPELMAKFYNTMKGLDSNPRELFYAPLGGIKRGQEIGPIGGHSDHVHYAA